MSQRERLCYNCNGPGHIKINCPKAKTDLCFNCNAPGHIRRNCPNPKGDKKNELKAKTLCFNCNAPGHIRRNCPNPEKKELRTQGDKKNELRAQGDKKNELEAQGDKRTQDDDGETQDDEVHAVNEVERTCTTQQMTSQTSHLHGTPPDPSQTAAEPSNKESITLGVESNSTTTHQEVGMVSHQKDFACVCEGISDDKLCNSSQNNGNGVKSGDDGSEVKRGDDGSEVKVSNGVKKSDGSEVKSDDGRVRRDGGKRSIRPAFPPFIDTHCHLEYVFERHRHQGTFSDFRNHNSYPKNFDGCIASFCDPAAFSSFGIWRDLMSEPDVWAAFGVHPHNAKYYHSQHLEDKVIESVQHEKCVALGEIGLDYAPHSSSNSKTQREVFSRLLKVGITLRKPFIVHCRDAEEDLLRLMSADVPSDWKIHLHCFTGKLDIARQFLKQFPNLYLGVTGNVTYRDCVNVRTVAREVPLERLLVETDAPYNTPRNLPRVGRCKFSHPAHAHYVAKEIAHLKAMDLSEVLGVIRENTRTVYGI